MKRVAYISRHGLVRFAAKPFGLDDLRASRLEESVERPADALEMSGSRRGGGVGGVGVGGGGGGGGGGEEAGGGLAAVDACTGRSTGGSGGCDTRMLTYADGC